MSDQFDDLLAPLAHLMVAQDVPFQDLSERLKGHYVQAAAAQTQTKPTDSVLSLKTGLSRREVSRLRAFESKPAKPNPLTRLVWLWRNDPAYNGAPLPKTGADSFESLARHVLQDVHPRSLLALLEQAGTVAVTDTTITLKTDAYVPTTGSTDQLAYLTENVGDHLSAALHNLHTDATPFFERALHFTGLTQAQTTALQDQFQTAQMQLLQSLSTQAEAMKAGNKGTGDTRIRAGGYVFTAKEDAQ